MWTRHIHVKIKVCLVSGLYSHPGMVHSGYFFSSPHIPWNVPDDRRRQTLEAANLRFVCSAVAAAACSETPAYLPPPTQTLVLTPHV